MIDDKKVNNFCGLTMNNIIIDLVADLENKLRRGKNTMVVFGTRKEKKDKENIFLMFSCLIKILVSTKENNFIMFDGLIKNSKIKSNLNKIT